MLVPFIDLKKQYQSIKDDLDQAVAEVMASGHYVLGPNVAALEQEVAAFCGAKYTLGVANGTDALHLALRAAGVKAGDEVILPPFTFFATAEVISYIGAAPVFADIDPETFTLDPKQIEVKITKKTKALLPVQLYGQCADMAPLQEIAKKHNLKIIEDAAQSLGAKYNNVGSGSLGNAAGFSFFPTKNLGAAGDGGMIATSDEGILNRAKLLRGHGSQKTYEHEVVGYNSRLDEIQAAILRIKLRLLPSWIEKRRAHAKLYNALLADLPLKLPKEARGNYHIYHQYTIRTEQRDALHSQLKEKGIASMIYYPLSIHLQKAYAYLGLEKGSFPLSEMVQNEVLSLPITAELEAGQIEEVAGVIRKFFSLG
jgi:dTDP-4-amino-4,6-dideoxygalactose transaminase